MAGITDIIFVVSEQSEQIRNYYRSNIDLNDYLKRNGKAELLELVRPIKANLHFVVQPSYGKHGTAIPVSLASEYIDAGESAVVLMGDDFIWNKDGSSEVRRLIEATPDGTCGILAAKVELKKGGTYGLIVQDEEGFYKEIIDQPLVENNPPSNLINISKYLLTKEVIDAAGNVPPAHNGEYQLPDAVNDFVIHGGKVKVVTATGQYLDGGTVQGWFKANQVVIGDM